MGEGVLSPPFPRVGGVLHGGDVPLTEAARTFGTPLYVYDIRWIEARTNAFARAFQGVDLLLAYSVKANGNLTLLRRLEALGCGADVTSEGELFLARRAGIPAERIVFAGVGKTERELELALREGIHAIHVESAGELERLAAVARRLGVDAPFSIRVNPDVYARTPHEYTRTGTAATKFGVPYDETAALYLRARALGGLRPVGIDVHIGSQIVEPEPYVQALERLLELVAALGAEGVVLEEIDLGGGYGVAYDDEPGMDVDALAREVVPRVRGAGLRLLLEPGRWLVGEAGVLLTEVQYVKRSGPKTFVICDGGMSELIRPSHYGGFHRIEPVVARPEARVERVDVVGPICETGDFLARDRELPLPEPGDLLAVRTVGAYGFAMASNYNGRLRPAEVVVEDGRATLVRARETVDDLIRGMS